MLPRTRSYQLAFFDTLTKRSNLNWLNLIFLVIATANSPRDDGAHQLNSDGMPLPNTLSEGISLGLSIFSFSLFFLINKDIVEDALYSVGEYCYPRTRYSPALKTCIERGKRISEKIQRYSLDDLEYPKEFECMIGLHIMCCPVAASDGQIYEFNNIRNVRISAATREKITTAFNPLVKFQDQIETWVDEMILIKYRNAVNSGIVIEVAAPRMR